MTFAIGLVLAYAVRFVVCTPASVECKPFTFDFKSKAGIFLTYFTARASGISG